MFQVHSAAQTSTTINVTIRRAFVRPCECGLDRFENTCGCMWSEKRRTLPEFSTAPKVLMKLPPLVKLAAVTRGPLSIDPRPLPPPVCRRQQVMGWLAPLHWLGLNGRTADPPTSGGRHGLAGDFGDAPHGGNTCSCLHGSVTVWAGVT